MDSIIGNQSTTVEEVGISLIVLLLKILCTAIAFYYHSD